MEKTTLENRSITACSSFCVCSVFIPLGGQLIHQMIPPIPSATFQKLRRTRVGRCMYLRTGILKQSDKSWISSHSWPVFFLRDSVMGTTSIGCGVRLVFVSSRFAAGFSSTYSGLSSPLVIRSYSYARRAGTYSPQPQIVGGLTPIARAAPYSCFCRNKQLHLPFSFGISKILALFVSFPNSNSNYFIRNAVRITNALFWGFLFMSTPGERIRARRVQFELTVKAVADYAGWSRQQFLSGSLI